MQHKAISTASVLTNPPAVHAKLKQVQSLFIHLFFSAMSGSTDSIQLDEQSSAAAAQKSNEPGHYSIPPYQSLRPARNPPALYHNTRSGEKCDLTLPEETYKQLDPATVRVGEESSTHERDCGEFAAYTSMSAAAVSPSSGPPLPPIPHQQDLRLSCRKAQTFNASDYDMLQSKKTGAPLIQIKGVVFILGLCMALFFLLSSAALALGVLNLIQVPESDKQAGALNFAANHSQQVGGGEDIAARVRSLEESLGQLQARFQLQSNMSGANETAISTLSSRVDQLGSQLSEVSGSLANQELIDSISSQLNDTSASLASLRARMNSRVELYRGCHKDTSTCRTLLHSNNPYWYLCDTPFLRLNITVLFSIT